MILVLLNGESVTEMDRRKWTSAKKNYDGSDIPSWRSRPKAELATKGCVGFLGNHAGVPTHFHRRKIQNLPPK